jgi:hypothetical protein
VVAVGVVDVVKVAAQVMEEVSREEQKRDRSAGEDYPVPRDGMLEIGDKGDNQGF